MAVNRAVSSHAHPEPADSRNFGSARLVGGLTKLWAWSNGHSLRRPPDLLLESFRSLGNSQRWFQFDYILWVLYNLEASMSNPTDKQWKAGLTSRKDEVRRGCRTVLQSRAESLL